MLITPERNLLSDDLIEVLEYLRVRWNTLHPSVDISEQDSLPTKLDKTPQAKESRFPCVSRHISPPSRLRPAT
jgi:hypothetical protein